MHVSKYKYACMHLIGVAGLNAPFDSYKIHMVFVEFSRFKVAEISKMCMASCIDSVQQMVMLKLTDVLSRCKRQLNVRCLIPR